MGKFSSLAEKRRQLQGRKMKRKEGDFSKKFPCKRFRNGVCEFTNDDCKYAHEDGKKED